jgi:hypothetical protein
MSAPTPKEATAADELVEALFGGPPVCAKQPDLRCLPECEYGLAGPCVRLRREEAMQQLDDLDREPL